MAINSALEVEKKKSHMAMSVLLLTCDNSKSLFQSNCNNLLFKETMWNWVKLQTSWIMFHKSENKNINNSSISSS